jgi:hypothetical protein
MRHRGQRLARRYPNGEFEGILEGPTPMVRSDLRKDMVGIPKISGPQERERKVEHSEGTSLYRFPQSLVGNQVTRDKIKLRPSAMFLRK